MDDKDLSENKSEDEENETSSDAENATTSSSKVLKVSLPGSHTDQTETETDALMLQQSKNYEHVKGLRVEMIPSPTHDTPQLSKSYDNVVGVKAEEVTSQTIENVREFVKQLDARERAENANVTSQYQVIEQPKRAYMESLTLTPNQSADTCEELKEITERQQIGELRTKFEEGSQKEKMEESKSEVDRPLDHENQEIAERFKQIMVMFDSFTKNLESLDHLAVKEPDKTASTSRRNFCSTQRKKEVLPAVHDSTGYMSLLDNHETPRVDTRIEMENVLDIEESSSQPTLLRASSKASLEHTRKDCATTMSDFQLHHATEPLRCATIACQTSQHENIIFLSPSTSMTTSNAEPPAYVNDGKLESFAIDSNTPTSTRALISGTTNRPTDVLKHFTPETSGRTIIKIPESPSVIELSAYAGSPPCERTHHTLHIATTASPSSSIMNRQPLCQRLWNAITDFCAAICICLQVNKDCIFCLGFFIAFVVSASFLTAFFYRTLSVNPQIFQQQMQNIDHPVQPAFVVSPLHTGERRKKDEFLFNF